jgi:glucosylceramidase
MVGLEIAAVVTECTGTNDSWTNTFRWDAENLIFGSIEAGSTGLLMWNLVLDEHNGPKTAGGCETCRGLLTFDSLSGDAQPTPEFYALAHLSRAADPGAVVLGVQRREFVTTVTFLNPDGRLGVFGFNRSSEARVVRIEANGGQPLTIHVRSHEYFTARQSPGF